jgi:hypothetical protein
MLKNAFDSDEYWLMFEEHLVMFKTIFKDINIHNYLSNIIVIAFKNFRVHRTKDSPFKKILSLTTKFKNEIYFMDLCTFIFTRYNNVLTVKNNLLFLQIIFEEENIFKDNLFHIIENESTDLNLKLEACDILYLKGTQNIKTKVQDILKNILPDLAYTNNPENVHLSSVVTSVNKTVECFLKENKGKICPLNLYEILLSKFQHHAEFIKIEGSLNRIFNYNFLKFSKFNLSLKEIIENVWLIVDSRQMDLKNQLLMRLEQELIDMYDTCSQGYLTRLINIFSGFEMGNLGITISFEDEIYAIFSNKVNNLVANSPESIKDKLLEELMVKSNDHENRLNLIQYLRPNLPKIWNEIFETFKDDLTITDLDLYCRKVTMRYEGCS